jgi:tetrapyrrole methylase family protein/MazG family protein
VKTNATSPVFDQFTETIRALRSPGGCPWDLAQTHSSLVPYAIEETYELTEAIASSNDAAIREELGDVLLQVVLHSIIAEQRGAFSISDVVADINKKMIRRHPHVFEKSKPENANIENPSEAINHFLKQKEKEKSADKKLNSLGIPQALPALQKAQKIGDKSKRFNFDWNTAKDVLEKVIEELNELKSEISSKGSTERLNDELGDLLFTSAQLGRHLGLDSEQSLQAANRKFESRLFKMLEIGRVTLEEFSNLSSEKKEALWNKAKKAL